MLSSSIVFSLVYNPLQRAGTYSHEEHVSHPPALQLPHHDDFSSSPAPKSETKSETSSLFSGMTHSNIISRKLMDSSSIQRAGKLVIFMASRYSGVSWISILACDKSPNSSRASCARDRSVSVSGDAPTIRISIVYLSDFFSGAAEAPSGEAPSALAVPSAPSAPSSFFSVRTSTSFGTSSGTYSWNSEATTTASVSS